MSLSAIVPALNEEKLIASTLSHLKRSVPKGTQIILADGHSSDRTRAIAKKYANVVREARKKGTSIASGRNAGVRLATGDILLFCDADTRPDKAFVNEALQILRKQPDVVSVGCEIKPDVPDWNTQLFFSFLNLIVRVSTFLKNPVIAGNCVLYRASAFRQVGGFDESMHASEDQDLSQRIAKVGKVVLLTQFTAKTSNRRLEHEGWFGLLWDWGGT
ncbi:MAG: glycosyltransferase, partial [Candidatus Micrarchaeota archaeon]|nr:glycosyltransferase [Candidatus Micrarchaeota archaeon]